MLVVDVTMRAPPLVVGDLRLDPRTWQVRRRDREISLTRTEFGLLELLMRHPRQVLTRAQLYEGVWGCNLDGSKNSPDVPAGGAATEIPVTVPLCEPLTVVAQPATEPQPTPSPSLVARRVTRQVDGEAVENGAAAPTHCRSRRERRRRAKDPS